MMAKQKTVFAIDKDGKQLYVQIDAIMHPLCAMVDGIPITFFGKEKKGYLDIDTAIEWLEKECRLNPAYAEKDGGKLLPAVRSAKEKFLAGKVIDAD